MAFMAFIASDSIWTLSRVGCARDGKSGPGVGAIDAAGASMVVDKSTIADAGPRVFGGSKTLKKNALQFSNSGTSCLILSGKAKKGR